LEIVASISESYREWKPGGGRCLSSTCPAIYDVLPPSDAVVLASLPVLAVTSRAVTSATRPSPRSRHSAAVRRPPVSRCIVSAPSVAPGWSSRCHDHTQTDRHRSFSVQHRTKDSHLL